MPDVCEVYSPPRIVPEATELGLKPGLSLDIRVDRSDGQPWNFSLKEHRDEVVERVLSEEPMMIIGSPPWTMFSILQNGNRWRHTPAAWNIMIDTAHVGTFGNMLVRNDISRAGFSADVQKLMYIKSIVEAKHGNYDIVCARLEVIARDSRHSLQLVRVVHMHLVAQWIQKRIIQLEFILSRRDTYTDIRPW